MNGATQLEPLERMTRGFEDQLCDQLAQQLSGLWISTKRIFILEILSRIQGSHPSYYLYKHRSSFPPIAFFRNTSVPFFLFFFAIEMIPLVLLI